MNPANLHQSGDCYDLVNNLGTTITVQSVTNAEEGRNIHIFRDDDLAILMTDNIQSKPYLALEYGDIDVGAEIGVAGYPLPEFIVTNGQLSYNGLIFRVAKNVITAAYVVNLPTNTGFNLANVQVIEVNFMFVPGNSGGPIFAADTGRVLGYVEGYRMQKIQETVETATLIPNLPQGVSGTYINNQSALYSIGIKLNRIRSHLEQFGVTL
jgi:hypothetical protein